MSRRAARSAVRAVAATASAALLVGCVAPDRLSTDAPTLVPPALGAAIDGLLVSTVTFVPVGTAGEEGSPRLVVRVAERPEDRAQGLKGVRDLPEGVGMLFVFPEPAPPSGRGGFWMLDTLIALDIAFVAQGTVVGTATMQPCPAQPCPVTHPGVSYDAAIETVAGWLEARGIGIGTTVTWTPPAAVRG
jgi:uncharacterized membrane protein (UPF0127 family)